MSNLFSVDETVTCDAPSATPLAEELGYFAHPLSINSRVVFITAKQLLGSYSSYNKILYDTNVESIDLVGHDEVFPLASGLGYGLGLEYNVSVLALKADYPVSAIKVFPSGEFRVFTTNDVNGALQLLGNTISGVDSCFMSFTSSPTTTLVLKHIGAFSISKVLLYTQFITFETNVVPIFENSFSVPYTSTNQTSLTRRGGMYTGNIRAMNVVIKKSSLFTRQVSKQFYAISIEEDYVSESALHKEMIDLCDNTFPLLSNLERVSHEHYNHIKRSIESINNYSVITRTIHFDTSIITEPLLMNLIKGCTYSFSSPLTISGVSYDTITVDDSLIQAVVEVNQHVCAINVVPSVTMPLSYELPTSLFHNVSLNDTLSEIQTLINMMPQFSKSATPNSGNIVSHVSFIDALGRELTCEQSLFLAGELVQISIYSTMFNTINVYIDDVYVQSETLTTSRFKVTNITLPVIPGVHCIRTENSSSVMFRISELTKVHAPVHPHYYTSGQLQGDNKTSSVVTLTIEHANMDILPNTTITTSSPANFITINDTVFAARESTTIAALLCRSNIVDLMGNATVIEDTTTHTFCDEYPWLSCYDMHEGNIKLSCQHSLKYFTLWWTPGDLSENCTLLQGIDCCLRIRNNTLQLQVESVWYQVPNIDTYVTSSWNLIAFNEDKLYINGQLISTSVVSVDGQTASFLIIGAQDRVNLLPLFRGNSVNVEGDSNECKLRITSPTEITQVKLISSGRNVTFNRSSTNVPVQDFFTSDSFVSQISGIETTPPSVILNAELIFNSAGYFRCLVMYNDKMTDSHISNAYLNRDSVISFFHKHVNVQATGEELNSSVSETYNQLANVPDANSAWVTNLTTSSIFVTPPSLVLLDVSQSTPYGLNQSVTLNFNRRIEVFIRDDSTLFTMNSVHGSQIIRADVCTLTSYKISISNFALALQANTTYTLTLDAGRLYQFSGHVPCLAGSVTFTTVT
jgi:hypothetical protein